MKIFILLCALIPSFAFVPNDSACNRVRENAMIIGDRSTPGRFATVNFLARNDDYQRQDIAVGKGEDGQRGVIQIMAGISSFGLLSALPLVAFAADDVEYAELPPPYIPVAFGFALLVGVGLLTGSLGDVLDEEASLGLQSGARAKKEIERSRSSYFKKK